MPTPSYREELISQIPALQLLMAMGWEYLTPVEALALRGGKKSAVVLTGVLEPWLAGHNSITHKGQRYAFSEGNIREALLRLVDIPPGGLLPANEHLYELLTLGISLPQTIGGDARSYSLHYIDWAEPWNNVYHVADEFIVERSRSHLTRRPDIVLFVNGIPLAVIECKRPDLDKGGEKAVVEAISQMLRNQRDDEIPHLFAYSQLLMAVSTNDALYATTGSGKPYWAPWKEHDAQAHETRVQALIDVPLAEEDKSRLYDHRDGAFFIRRDFDARESRLPTAQDRAIASLLDPHRLLELAFQYIVYDAGVKKIARHQQVYAIQATLARVAHLNHQGERSGGVIWHTTGTGKSITMVMLAKALTLHPAVPNPRVVIVTDRVDLDTQIWGTFTKCGKSVQKAGSGRQLIDLIRSGRADVITTVINKFETVAGEKLTDDNINIFVLVDESHRSQYGAIHAKMRQVFRRACYIGFTGTPLTRAEKNTARKFGDFIHKYTMRQAVEDGVVVPLLYEGRMVGLDVDRAALDTWFERVTQSLSDAQKADLKHKLSRAEEISKVDLRIKEIAYDLSMHYAINYQGTGFKAMLATPSKEIALKYLRCLEDFKVVRPALVISPPDTREGHEEVDNFAAPEVEAFWKRMMARYQSEENYNRELVADFARADGVEVLIVVDKLLVGFDEPRCTVLYIDKPLKEHGLLQAIARVNRLFAGKDNGTIIDYRGVLGELSQAIDVYNALEEYDAEDVDGMITDVSAEIERLPQLHSDLWDIFKTVDVQDVEALERFLEPEDRRRHFYEALAAFARSLKIALGTVVFYETASGRQINTYKRDLAFFHHLRVSVRMRYAEAIDYHDYEQKVRKLLDEHVKASAAQPITKMIDIFDQQAFDEEVERLHGDAARADTIAHRLKRTISERMELDPAFYRKFSEMIDETIEAYRQGRLTEAEYLEHMKGALEAVRSGQDSGQPVQLGRYRHASAYYGIIHDILLPHFAGGDEQEAESYLADIAIELERLIDAHKIRDWASNADIQNTMKTDIEDYLYRLKDVDGLPISGAEMDTIIENVIDVARKRDRLFD